MKVVCVRKFSQSFGVKQESFNISLSGRNKSENYKPVYISFF